MTAALIGVLLAAALLTVPGRTAGGYRLGVVFPRERDAGRHSRFHGFLATTGKRARRRRVPDDPADLAATVDLLAACLRAGLPVATSVRIVAGPAASTAGEALRATADLLELGADPVTAWAPARDCPATAELARAAVRTARSGAAMAGTCAELAQRIRAGMADKAEARAARAGVLIAAPLGLCFLPAFFCLGVIPVVLGLAAKLVPP